METRAERPPSVRVSPDPLASSSGRSDRLGGRLMATRASGRRTNVLALTSEVELVRLLRSILEPSCKVKLAANPAPSHESPDIVIVDAENVDLAALSQSKRDYPRARVIALCREYREADCIAVLDMDVDYLPRPFRAQDLAARVRVAELRRFNATVRRRHYRKGPLVFDLFNRRLAVDGRAIALAPSELTVLTLLAGQAGTVVTFDRLLTELGLLPSEGSRQALRSCIFRLRRKIERDPLHPEILLAEAGIGYRLAPSADQRPSRDTDQPSADERPVGLR